MTSGLGQGIEKALRNMEEEEEPEEQVAWDDPAVCAIIKELYLTLKSHLHEIPFWITYCDDMEILDRVIFVYENDERLRKYPSIVDLGDGNGPYHNPRHFPVHYLKTIKQWTNDWFAMSDEQRRERLDFSALAQRHKKWLDRELKENGHRICGSTRERNLEWFTYRDPETHVISYSQAFDWDKGEVVEMKKPEPPQMKERTSPSSTPVEPTPSNTEVLAEGEQDQSPSSNEYPDEWTESHRAYYKPRW